MPLGAPYKSDNDLECYFGEALKMVGGGWKKLYLTKSGRLTLLKNTFDFAHLLLVFIYYPN